MQQQNNNLRPQAQVLQWPAGAFTMRHGTEDDVLAVTTLIHRAYKLWVVRGLNVSPARQTPETTRQHLLAGGLVFEREGRIVATVTVDVASYNGKQYLEFKKFAVDPDLANAGVGTKIYQLVEAHAREHNYHGMILETVAEAEWLYDWYLRLGYQVVDGKIYPGSTLKTLRLVKNF